MRRLHILLGLAFWSIAALGLGFTLERHWAGEGRAVTSGVWSYFTGRRPTIELEFPAATDLALGDPVFGRDAAGAFRQVGEVSRLPGREQPVRRARVRQASVAPYPGTQPPAAPQVTYYASPDSLSWVASTLLPPERRKEVAGQLQAAFAEHQDEILAALRPLVEESLRESVQIIGEDLGPVLARHKPELQALGAKYQRDIVNKELVPLAKSEVWPIVRRRAEPTVNEVGQELWEKVSLWRFGWRYAYDKSPLPDKSLTKKEWERFVEDEAMPVLSEHTDDFVAVLKGTLSDVSKNRRVRESLSRSFTKVLDDPQFEQLLWQVVQETVVENRRLRAAMKRRWTSPEARRAVAVAAERLEPTVRRVVDTVIGSREHGITPEFAQVLRNQVLAKDRRWLLLESDARPRVGDAASLPRVPVRLGGETTLNPFATPATGASGTRR